jgi:uncharacterized protein (TIGR02444 family)
MSEAIWDWVVAAYARPGVAQACLDLQDRHDQSTPLLLFAAWAASTGRALDADVLEAAADMARAWEGAAVGPLRRLRATLKAPIPDIEDAARLAVREQVQAVELDSERRLLLALAEIAPPASAAIGPVLDGLVAAARAWSRITPRRELETLAVRLST